MTSWEDFLQTRLLLNPVDLVHEHVREALFQLPSMIRIRGDAVALDYAIDDGVAVVRLRLREGQAHQLLERDIPELDRPVRFTVVRGGGGGHPRGLTAGAQGETERPGFRPEAGKEKVPPTAAPPAATRSAITGSLPHLAAALRGFATRELQNAQPEPMIRLTDDLVFMAVEQRQLEPGED